MSVDPQPEPHPQRSFIGNVNIVMVTYAIDGVLALITGALVARALGPEGRGAYALFVVSAAFAQLLIGLGIGNAAIYYLNKREISLRDVLAAVHIVTFASILIVAGVVAAVVPLDFGLGSVRGHELRFVGERIFGEGISPWLLVLVAPVMLYMNLLRLVLQALSKFIDLGIATIGQQAALLALVAVAFIVADPTPADVVLFLALASGCAAAYSLVRIGVRNIDVARIVRPRWDRLRLLARFGVQGEAGNILQLMNYRLDQYLVRAFVGLSGVGIYAVGASMTEAIFVMANAVALVLMPRLTSATPEEAASMTPVASRNTMLIAAFGAIALAAVAPVLLPAVFGEAFRDSVEPLWLLLPGTVVLTGSKVLTSYIFSQGKPLINTGITLVSLAVTLVADIALIPVFGVNGAAAASSLAYVAHFVAALIAYQKISKQPALGAVLPQFADVALYTGAARNAFARITGRTPVVDAGAKTGVGS